MFIHFSLLLALSAAVNPGQIEYNPVKRFLQQLKAKRNIGDGVFQNGIIDIGQLGKPGQASNYFQFDDLQGLKAKRNIGDGVFQNGIIDIGQLGKPGQASNYFQFDEY